MPNACPVLTQHPKTQPASATPARSEHRANEARNAKACSKNAAPSASESDIVELTIDGVRVDIARGATILDAAEEAGIRIPTLCFLRDVSAISSCRICLVEVEGTGELVPACSTKAENGMMVATASERVEHARKTALDLIISEHGLNSANRCSTCTSDGSCELQSICHEMGVGAPALTSPQKHKPVLNANPFIAYDPNLCIHCQRCVGACNNLARNHALQAGNRGTRTTILAPFGPDWKATSCESCGCCAQACPTGAISVKRRAGYRPWEIAKTLTTCPHCAVGCQLELAVKDGRIVDAYAAEGPANKGRLCVKGRSSSFDFVGSADRLTTPLIKNRATGAFEEATWDDALELVASKFNDIKREHGGAALAAFACSRSTNEDVYLFQKMARCAFETNNIDSCARV